ncbi:MAG: hypothetical protein ABSC00_01945 [Acidimicrobiales bacterium]
MRDRNVTRAECDGCHEHRSPHTAAGAAAVTAIVLVAGVSGCANHNGLALARQACGHVDRSLAIYRSVERSPGSAGTAGEQARALAQLRNALPIAASAAQEATQWQALMTTLAESARVPESDLVHALEAQCAVARGNGVAPPPTPTTTSRRLASDDGSVRPIHPADGGYRG